MIILKVHYQNTLLCGIEMTLPLAKKLMIQSFHEKIHKTQHSNLQYSALFDEILINIDAIRE